VTSLKQLPERERNTLLRRVDWRFLLRQEGEPRALVPGDGDLARAVAFVSEPAAGQPPDLVALVNPGRREIEAAAAQLAPGGTLYVELYRPQLGGRARLTRQLEAAGLEDVCWYWPWPSPSRGPAFWLPLDSPEALAFFLGQRRRAPTVSRRLLAAVWPWVLRLRVLVPLCVVAQKPGGLADAVERAVRRHATGGAASWILLSGGRRSINKVIGLPIVRPASRPQLVVKFARSAAEEKSLLREARVLRLVANSRPQLTGVPRVLFLERRCGRLGLGETALEGEPLLSRLNRKTFDPLCNAVTEWLIGLAGRGEPHPQPAWRCRLVDEPLALFAQNYAPVVSPDELGSARAALSSLDALPLVCEQRDCAPWNVLLAGDQVSVADWESAEPSGLPALDLVYFLTNAALLIAGVLDRGPVAKWYADALDPRSAAGRTVARCEALYCERVGIEPGLLPVLRLLCWTIHARSEYRRFEGDVAAEPTAGSLETGLFLELWRTELIRQTS
jgi:Phosphotransferase enzyme family